MRFAPAPVRDNRMMNRTRSRCVQKKSAHSQDSGPKTSRSIRVFEGDYSESICESVTKYGREAIKDKGSFSLCIPGGSIVKALGGLKANAMDFTKVHVFFANERISEQKCYAGGLEARSAASNDRIDILVETSVET